MSVEQTGRGRSPWRVRWLEEGRHRSRSFPTEREAREFEVENRRRLRMGAFAPREPSAMPLDEWLDRWVEIYSIAWEWNTSRGRTSLIDTHARPFLGRVRLRDLVRGPRADVAAGARRRRLAPSGVAGRPTAGSAVARLRVLVP